MRHRQTTTRVCDSNGRADALDSAVWPNQSKGRSWSFYFHFFPGLETFESTKLLFG